MTVLQISKGKSPKLGARANSEDFSTLEISCNFYILEAYSGKFMVPNISPKDFRLTELAPSLKVRASKTV